MSGLFSTNRIDKRADQLLLLIIQDDKVDYISPQLLDFLGWKGVPTTPAQVLEPDSWTTLQRALPSPLPHTEHVVCLGSNGHSVPCHAIHYVLRPLHHLFFFAPDTGTSDFKSRSDLRELFDFMNHETRTPINSLLGLLELLSQTPLSEEQHQYLETMRGVLNSLLHLLSDALDSSRISAGKMTLKCEPFDLYEMIERIVARNKLLSPHLEVKLEYSPTLPHQIYADGHRLEQVIINVVSNALKHTSQGGVSINVGYGTRLDKGRDSLLIKIIDTGSGIDPEQQKRLFSPYERAAENMTMGSGLGLYISKQIVELHGGTIGLESTLGKGTIVSIEMPLVLPPTSEQDVEVSLEEKTPPQSTNAAGSRTEPPSSGLPLLLVDDNVINVMVVQKFLKRWGYESVVAQSGVEALQAIDKEDFGLILMDLRMPEMDGFEATRRIRARGDQRARTPIIALTASTEPGVKEQIAAVQMEGYLFKPFNAEELHHTIAQYLGWKDDTQNG